MLWECGRKMSTTQAKHFRWTLNLLEWGFTSVPNIMMKNVVYNQYETLKPCIEI